MHEDRSMRATTWPSTVSSLNENFQPTRLSLLGRPSPALYEQAPSQPDFIVPRKPLPLTAAQPDAAAQKAHPSQSDALKASWQPLSTLATTLRWWLPELVASFMSVASLLAIVAVLAVYDGHSLDSLNLPRQLSLNGLVAILATLHRMFLAVPLGSLINQEGWLHFAKNKRPASYLRDLPRFDDAAKGPWGSLLFILTSPRK